MTIVLENLPPRVIDRLGRKAKISGKTIEAEVEAILTEAVDKMSPPDDMDDLQKMVWEMYNGKLPGNVVDEFLAERRKMWGEDYRRSRRDLLRRRR